MAKPASAQLRVGGAEGWLMSAAVWDDENWLREHTGTEKAEGVGSIDEFTSKMRARVGLNDDGTEAEGGEAAGGAKRAKTAAGPSPAEILVPKHTGEFPPVARCRIHARR